jgi:hypothetical protein
MMSRNVGVGLSVLACLLFVPTAAQGWRGGPPAGKTGSIASGGGTCMQCHGAPGAGAATIVGLPTGYEADAIYDLIVRVSDPAQAGAGFQMSIEDAVGTHVGTLSVTDATNTQLNTGDANFMNHTGAGVDNAVANWAGMGNAAEYAVRWQAPSTDSGPITFWLAGNAINNNLQSSGDDIYLTNETISFTGGPVPTVSEWGLLVMAILVLTGGTLVLRQRPTDRRLTAT